MVHQGEWQGLATALPSAVALEKIAEAVDARLRQSSYMELRRIKWAIHQRVLRLFGCVSSYYVRQLAQAQLAGLDGIDGIDNQLDVVPRRSPRW